MMPGIMPSLLMSGSIPIHNAYVDPDRAQWYGSPFNWYTTVYAEHSGGTAPFTYLWSSDGFEIAISSPNSRLTQLTSSSGNGGTIYCLITDATGQSISIDGTVLGQHGGAG